MTFYDDCVKMREDFAPNFGDKGTGYCIITTHRLTLPFLTGNFFPKETCVFPSFTFLSGLGPL
jgi:hypothetical protein